MYNEEEEILDFINNERVTPSGELTYNSMKINYKQPKKHKDDIFLSRISPFIELYEREKYRQYCRPIRIL
jgi:hypothetical protein